MLFLVVAVLVVGCWLLPARLTRSDGVTGYWLIIEQFH